MSKKQVDMLLRVLPCSAAVCYALPVQLKGVGGEGFKLSHLLFKHSSVNKMLVGVGKQTMLLVEICWKHTLRGKGVVICSCTGFGLGCACAARMCSGRSKTTWLAGFSLMSSKAWMTTAGTLHSLRALQYTARLTTATWGTPTSMPASATSSCLS